MECLESELASDGGGSELSGGAMSSLGSDEGENVDLLVSAFERGHFGTDIGDGGGPSTSSGSSGSSDDGGGSDDGEGEDGDAGGEAPAAAGELYPGERHSRPLSLALHNSHALTHTHAQSRTATSTGRGAVGVPPAARGRPPRR